MILKYLKLFDKNNKYVEPVRKEKDASWRYFSAHVGYVEIARNDSLEVLPPSLSLLSFLYSLLLVSTHTHTHTHVQMSACARVSNVRRCTPRSSDCTNMLSASLAAHLLSAA